MSIPYNTLKITGHRRDCGAVKTLATGAVDLAVL
jgi:hypothetical protein